MFQHKACDLNRLLTLLTDPLASFYGSALDLKRVVYFLLIVFFLRLDIDQLVYIHGLGWLHGLMELPAPHSAHMETPQAWAIGWITWQSW
jgi:hypothetical protein